jgi:hypothetical protein
MWYALLQRSALIVLCVLLFAALTPTLTPVQAATDVWIDNDESGNPRIHLYFFWTQTCPHCLNARPVIEDLAPRYPWLVLHSHDVSSARAHLNQFIDMSARLGETARSVPAFLFCGRMEIGFDRAETTGKMIENALIECHNQAQTPPPDSAPDIAPPQDNNVPLSIEEDSGIHLPGWGNINPHELSLPVFTLIIAGLDAFNPCAFFVLLFLLSLLVHARSRGRMLFIGGIFLFFSGLIYFLFMAAWLNIFRWLDEIVFITMGAGILAIAIGMINIKDYFWFKSGVSLSIPEAAKPGLYQRIRGLLKADNLATLTLGTITLAIAVNAYELLCTAGFPMVYTRVLTLADLSHGGYYAYLLLYNIIYVIPLLIITLIFTFTMGARKLSANEGRLLKLVSGWMMLGLGIILVSAPQWLNQIWVAVLLLCTAILLSWGIHHFNKAHPNK